MQKSSRWAIALALLVTSPQCGTDAPDAINRTTTTEQAAVSLQDLSTALGVLSTRAVLFEHASVGAQIVGGLRALLDANSGPEPRIVNTTSAAQVLPGIWADHYLVAENGSPLEKIAEFQQTLTAGAIGSRLGDKLDVAFLKLCFADFWDGVGFFSSGGTPAGLFATYQAAVAALEGTFPGVAFIHITAPLYVATDTNARREAFNALMRANFPANRVFDLALMESTDESGNRVYGPGQVPALYPAYSTDGGHLTAAFRDTVARALVAFAAAAVQPESAPVLTSVTLSPASVVGGGSSTGTVALSGVAPAGGASVLLASSSAAATVPASVLVAAGATSATFPVSTAVVATATAATVTAFHAGASRTVVLSVAPASAGSLAQDAGFPTRNVYAWTTGSKAFSFTTPGPDRLVTVAISYLNYTAGAVTHTVSGGGLTWAKVAEAQTSPGAFASLWTAWVANSGTYAASFSPGVALRYDAMLTVHSYTGSSASGIGATRGATGSGSLPAVGGIATSGTPSTLLAAGYSFGSTAPTVDTSSTRTAVDVSSGMAFWTQASTGTLQPGIYAIGLTAPASREWAMAVAEIKAHP